MKEFFNKRPWIWLLCGFLVMMASSIATVVIAVRYEPQEVPLDEAPNALHAAAVPTAK